jgi:5'-3' exonuclease
MSRSHSLQDRRESTRFGVNLELLDVKLKSLEKMEMVGEDDEAQAERRKEEEEEDFEHEKTMSGRRERRATMVGERSAAKDHPCALCSDNGAAMAEFKSGGRRR